MPKTVKQRPVITLLTDFGSSDHYAAAMKGVMIGICPGVRLIDISHEITPFAIPEAAYTLSQASSCFPAGTIHLAVVHPASAAHGGLFWRKPAGIDSLAPITES